MESQVKFEICCGSLQSALNAQEAGAHRVELCSALSLGGLTPSYGTIEMARKMLEIDINVLIRTRGGDFLYGSDEVAVMIRDIRTCASIGVQGVVIGALDPLGNIDMDCCRALVATARNYGLSVTFHRAIDRAYDIFTALDDAIALGVDRVLTSGGKPSAYQGMDTIAQMNKMASGRTIIMPGAGITPSNIKEIITSTGVSEVHFSGSVSYDSPMLYRGGVPEDYTHTESSVNKIRETIGAANNRSK
ncbi:MAG: copper homeostasis protein CutC [Bacteroidales bacterium]|nr:copper homeostasis protein CutC [Bacteroidales bacterium]